MINFLKNFIKKNNEFDISLNTPTISKNNLDITNICYFSGGFDDEDEYYDNNFKCKSCGANVNGDYCQYCGNRVK